MNSCSVAVSMQDISRFNEINFAIESFNDAFGSLIFGAVLSGGSHLAVYIMTALKGTSEISDTIMTALFLILYWVQLLSGAEVSHQVSSN